MTSGHNQDFLSFCGETFGLTAVDAVRKIRTEY